ncbi:hypothetical protein COY93_01980 [Candidatus Uhrbacteria bacterium CG_4_10_14_0_8_um_filter_58_22]|uniref:DUF3784 domain-containing protein n=1 Tax=Candidatus Uhrbacteria bacterium CG_4_10_14_0_8_um_filter_58_22 TaxID=1975029 RepID=A0A2M7QA86_9BACT|nr:MAG: hypothetical protein AUJ19_02935 [Parcubacteria group bacterium CG1_02_58_44]PIY62858.1 MAG: hypothetical protein COY93_01980 [Candidatus Uhrbacteria bacterium CG_4_10_14_0_8_um_filter_58_22]
MHVIYRTIGGLVLVGIGILPVLKTEWFMRNFGRIEWAERKLGDSRLFYKLIGLAVIFVGLMAMTGLLGSFLLGTVGTLFRVPA